MHWLQDHGDALWRYARSRVPAHACEDLVQDALLAALDSAESFDRRSSPETWLIGILRHKIADWYRRRDRDQPRHKTGEATEAHAESPFTPRGTWAKAPLSWDAVRDDEVLAALHRCREELPALLRDALDLREIRRVPAREVCQVLGISETNLWARLSRARLMLRGCIEGRIAPISRGKGKAR